MRRTLILILVLSSVWASAQYRTPYAELYDSPNVAEMKKHVGFLSSASMEGRLAGSSNEKDAAAYVRDCFEAAGVDVVTGRDGQQFGLRQENGDTLRSLNVAGVVSGYDRDLKDRYVVVGCRLDNLGESWITVDGQRQRKTFYGANGNASGVALMMLLAKQLNVNRVLLRRSVVLVAFGASLQSNAGSWYFVNRGFVEKDKIDAMVNLDMLGIPSRGFYAYTSSNTDLNNLITAQSATLQPIHPQIVSMEPVQSDHRSFYAAEIPSVFFTSGMYPEYNTDKDTASILEYDGMERELEYLYNFVVALSNGPSPEFSQSAQDKKAVLDERLVAYSDCDQVPTFLGSVNPTTFLSKWVYVYLKYPREAVEKGVQGKVLVDFVVDENGKVRDVKVRRGVHPLLDAEAVKVVSVSPDWKPGKVRGKKVATAMSIYVEFRLEKNK